MRLTSLLSALLIANAIAQTAEKRPAFEVTSVRPAADAKDPEFTTGIQISGDQVTARRVNLSMLIRAAYGLRARFRAGADWTDIPPLFDLRATIPAGASRTQLREMFQSLLADRFRLKSHMEQRERTVYALILANGRPMLRTSTNVDESLPGGALSGIASYGPAGGTVSSSPNGSSYRVRMLDDGGGELTFIGVTMEEFAYHLNDLEGAAIIDGTHLPGRYDLAIAISREEMCENCPTASQDRRPMTTPTLKDSLGRLGLRLEKQRTKVDVFVIDQLEKTPTEN